MFQTARSAIQARTIIRAQPISLSEAILRSNVERWAVANCPVDGDC